ncbi:hypothetical protein [uncultured Akkermansia sp.]|uniref:hypothetical protein n=1 Tax=uncultured Akkermansia sp. TaxID=512294 RepID=UPI002601EA3D|nr:hypothetical protein [uncultured Akkermansia sp.]
MSKATTSNTEPEKKTEQAAVIDTNILILSKEVRIGRSTFLKGAEIRVTKELADKLEADGKATIIY